MKKIYIIDSKNIAEGVKDVEKEPSALHYDGSRLAKAGLAVEETLAILANNSLEDAQTKIIIRSAIFDGINTYFCTPVKTMFVNALKMIAAPMVFFPSLPVWHRSRILLTWAGPA